MRAVLYREIGETPRVVDVADPECPDDGVVVRVAATGVCRSDWHAWIGHDPGPLPMVPGHEFAGEVVAVGPAVARWSVGDRVIVPFACGCGRCAHCAAGATNVCADQTQPGFTMWGSFAELVAVRAADANVVALPPGIDPVAAASLGCRFATAYRAVVSRGRLQAGESLAVHGCGGVGLSAVVIGAALGARVVAVDVAPLALDSATRAGAEVVIDGSGLTSSDIGDRIRAATGGGVHVSIDALGSEPTLAASVSGLRRQGRHVQVGLLLGASASPPVPMSRILAEELEILGSHGMPSVDYPAMLALLERADVDLGALVGRRIRLDDAPAALVAMGEPPTHATAAGMTVIDLSL
jgi:D-arabinose 1-dehydrogenase-like Zn-dependent alcohol dehydrogenase